MSIYHILVTYDKDYVLQSSPLTLLLKYGFQFTYEISRRYLIL